jgi:hypothetical protein
MAYVTPVNLVEQPVIEAKDSALKALVNATCSLEGLKTNSQMPVLFSTAKIILPTLKYEVLGRNSGSQSWLLNLWTALIQNYSTLTIL